MLINGYGPTECTTFAATYRIPRDLPADPRARCPIGRPITDTTLHVLARRWQPLPAASSASCASAGAAWHAATSGDPT